MIDPIGMRQPRTRWFAPEHMMVVFAIMTLWAGFFARRYPQLGYDAAFITIIGMTVCMFHGVKEKQSAKTKTILAIVYLLLVTGTSLFCLVWWLLRQSQ